MKNSFLKMTFAFVAMAFTGCVHWPANFHSGYYVQRASTTYEFSVANGAKDPVDYFYHGAYDVCLTEHQSGFEVVSQERDEIGSVRGTVICKGAPDEFLRKKYQNTTVKKEPSDFMAPGCFHFEVM
jgi:hypothetical protein